MVKYLFIVWRDQETIAGLIFVHFFYFGIEHLKE